MHSALYGYDVVIYIEYFDLRIVLLHIFGT